MRISTYLKYYIKCYLGDLSVYQVLCFFTCVFAIIVLIEIYYLKNNDRHLLFRSVWTSFSICLIIVTTLFGRRIGSIQFDINNVFNTYRMIGHTYIGNIINEIGLNIAIFIPLGTILSRKKDWRQVTVRALCVSLSVEICQAVLGIGVFEVCDLIHNLLGALIGNSVFKLFEQTTLGSNTGKKE